MRLSNIPIPYDAIAAFCERHHIRKLSLFGSVLREDFREDSDVDVLVEFEPDTEISLFDMGEMQVELSELLGRDVDLKTAGFLSRYFRDEILGKAVPVYERG